MSGKLMHERLREHAAKCAIGVFAVGDTEIVSLRAGEALALADEIERQYVPVPRFPDGEPVSEGSETCYGTVSYIDVEVSDTCWGSWIVHFDDGDRIEGTFSQRVKRPEPDSLEKLRDEMTRKRQALNAPSMDELETWADRLTALMERGA